MPDSLLLEDDSPLLLEDDSPLRPESWAATSAGSPPISRRRAFFLILASTPKARRPAPRISRRRAFFLLSTPGKSIPAPPDVLPSLPEAIARRVLATPEIIDQLPGGFWFGIPDDKSFNNQPYGTMIRIGEQIVSWITRHQKPPQPSGYRTVFQVTLVGPDWDALDLIHDAWERHIGPGMGPLSIRRRLFRQLLNDPPAEDFGSIPHSPTAENPVSYHWELTVLTNVWE